MLFYLLFIILATVLWFVHALGKEYNAEITIDVSYEGFPLGKEPRNSKNRKLTLSVTAYGFSLMRMQLKKALKNYTIKVSELRKLSANNKNVLRYKLSIYNIRSQFEEQLGSGITINNVDPEQIVFKVVNMSVKKLPIIPKVSLQMRSGYMMISPLKITPDSIKIKGNKLIVDTLSAIYTEQVIFPDVYKSFEKTLKLQEILYGDVELLTKNVVCKGKVVEYVDKTVKLNINPINFPDSVDVKFYPQTANIKYKTYINTIKSAENSNIDLVADYNKLTEVSNKLEVQILKVPKGIYDITIDPRYVNYVLTKKQTLK